MKIHEGCDLVTGSRMKQRQKLLEDDCAAQEQLQILSIVTPLVKACTIAPSDKHATNKYEPPDRWDEDGQWEETQDRFYHQGLVGCVTQVPSTQLHKSILRHALPE